MSDDPTEGLKKAARRVFWEVGRLEKGAAQPKRKTKYLLVREECRKCNGGVYEVLYEDGYAVAGTVIKPGTDCNDRCLDKVGGKWLSSWEMSEEDANKYLGTVAATDE